MKGIRKIICVALLLYAPCCFASDVSSKDIEIISNMLKYTRGNDGSAYKIAALYDPASEKSKSEAQDFVNEIQRSSEAKAANVTSSIVSVNDLSSGYNVAFVTSGLSGHNPAIQDFARKHKVLTISLDMSCATNNCCVIAIKNGSSVDIYLNEKTLTSYGLEMDATFKFMVKKV